MTSLAVPKITFQQDKTFYQPTHQNTQSKTNYRVESEKTPNVSGVLNWRCTKIESSEIFCVKFSRDNSLLAVGCGNSKIMVYSTVSNKTEFVLDPGFNAAVPCTSICFSSDNLRNILTASCLYFLTQMRMGVFIIGMLAPVR
jgi:hypothetical protein